MMEEARVEQHRAVLGISKRGAIRGVLTQESGEPRAITKNRQPGRCCDTGCTQPGQPVMVA